MNLEAKVLNGFERLSEALKSLLWEKAKVHGISPIQIQLLVFISNHKIEICNVSYMAKEFNVTKATISDAVRVLIKKEYLEKDFSPNDNRRYNLFLTESGLELVKEINNYANPVYNQLKLFSKTELDAAFDLISKLIFKLNQENVIQVQRTCYNCKFYKGDLKSAHYCNLLEKELKNQDIRLDCKDFES